MSFDVTTLALAKSYADQHGGGGGQVQPDWNQNDETAKDYVKNRPFYTETTEAVFVEESTVSFVDTGRGFYWAQFPSNFKATVGKTYKVYWDGTAYECTCVDFNDMPVIGNLSIGGIGSDTGEPFVIQVAKGKGIAIATKDTSASHTFSISGLVTEVVKIDEKYLPSNLATKSEVEVAQTTATSAQEAVDEIQSTGLSFIGSIGNTVFIGTDSDGQARIGNRHSPRVLPGGVDTLLVPAGLSFRYYDSSNTLINQIILSVSGIKDKPFLYLNNGTIRVKSEPKEDNEVATKSYVDAIALPPVTTEDNGKIMKVMDGAWAMDIPSDGTDISLGLTSTTVGQIAKISAVDDNGVPTAWEPVDMAQGILSGTTSDLTPTQVYDAVSAGIPVKVQYIDDRWGVLSFTAFALSESLNTIVSNTIAYYLGSYILGELVGDKNSNAWCLMTPTLAQKTDIPSSLKNPNALTIKIGSTTVTYDGSSAQTVEIADGTEVEY